MLSETRAISELKKASASLPAWFEKCPDQWLLHPDYRIRQAALRAIGRCKAMRHAARLKRALLERADRDYSLQVAAAEAMRDTGSLSFVPCLLEAALNEDTPLLNVRRVARHALDDLLFEHKLRGRQGFGSAHDRILNLDHPDPPGSGSTYATQIDEQVRLTPLTQKLLYSMPAFCRYASGQRPMLERGMEALLDREAGALETVQTVLRWLPRGMLETSSAPDKRQFAAWWRGAMEPWPMRDEWEEERILEGGKGSCDRFSRCAIALCRTRQVPGRLVIWYFSDNKRQQVTAEFFVNGAWRLCDPRYGLLWECSAWEMLLKPERVWKARVLCQPLAGTSKRAWLEANAPLEMFSQAGIVPADRMGTDP